ncbi:MAG: ABC transporter permease [Bacteroidales bacterium]|nr:ABC transporter permease [Bacteroidales bacterium]
MNLRRLIRKNIYLYKPFYRLTAIAVIVAVAVIVGSLVVGDSVRGTLLQRVEDRLGNTETIVFSRQSFMDEKILESLRHSRAGGYPLETGRLQDNPAMTTRGILLMDGFVSVSGRLIPVMVWGVDDLNIEEGQAKINRALHNEITVGARHTSPSSIVLRLPAAGIVPSGSMFVTDVYTTSLRLDLSDIVSVEQGGNISLQNEQIIPFNIFVNRAELAETMEVSGRINVILSDRIISREEFAQAWNYEISGLRALPRHCGLDPQSPCFKGIPAYAGMTTITSDRVFIQDQVIETLRKDDLSANRFFTYLANSIRKNEISIPYSFITAVDFFDGQPLNPDEVILSDYAARRLNARIGDTISVSYFISQRFRTLSVDSVFLRVSRVVPISQLQADSALRADFPGLSNVDRCADWNSDLPINMSLITDEREEFWRRYANTPKAIVPYITLAPRWENAFGSATALQISDVSSLKNLTHEMFDITLIHPRETAITAATSGVDFSSLFLALGFFIIISAAMLMIVPLSEMLFRRRKELHLLKAIGFSNKRILRLLWREINPVVWISAIGGVIAGLLYTSLVLFLLGNVWRGATHTDGFGLFPNFATVLGGLIVGVILSLFLVYFVIRKSTGAFRLRSTTRQVAERSRSHTSHLAPFGFRRLISASLRYKKKQALLSFVTLACGVLIVFSVGLNRQGFADSSQIRTATGGFALWAETSVPIFHNIQTEDGRSRLGLMNLSNNAHVLQLLKYSADDASCLNLNRVETPNVLGIEMTDLIDADFRITRTIFDGSRSRRDAMHCISTIDNFTTTHNGVIPALIDETVLTWTLMRRLGDTLVYLGERGDTVLIQIAGTLDNSIFQGHILIDKNLFSETWSEISGSEIMLVNVPEQEIEATKILLSQALNMFGIRVMTTNERMRLFYSVTDTYLTIFLTLGGLGLLLGIFSLIIVVRKNLLARTKEITLYRSLGFNKKRLQDLLYKENIIVPLSAILTGALGSLFGVFLGFGNVSIWVWLMAIMFLVGFIFSVIIFVKTTVRNYLQK